MQAGPSTPQETTMGSGEDRSEIVFFDVETTIPTRTGQKYALLEFGAILVCPRKLVEQHSYSTLVRPSDLSLISTLSVRCNGITRDAVTSAPSFADIADKVFDVLHGYLLSLHNYLLYEELTDFTFILYICLLCCLCREDMGGPQYTEI